MTMLIQRICSGFSGAPSAMLKMPAPMKIGDEGDERRHLEAQVLQQVVVERAAVRHGLDDRGEVVVGEDHDGGLLGDLGAGDAHRDADVGGLQRGRVVDAVAGHRDDVALLLAAAARGGPCPRARPGRRRRCSSSSRCSCSSLIAANSAPVTASTLDAELRRDRGRGGGVVAGDHPHPDAGALCTRRSRALRLGARRVDDADHAPAASGPARGRADRPSGRRRPGRSRAARHDHDALARGRRSGRWPSSARCGCRR